MRSMRGSVPVPCGRFFYSSITNPATRFVNNVVYAGVGLVGALSAVAGRISVGDLSCLFKLCQPVHQAFQRDFPAW